MKIFVDKHDDNDEDCDAVDCHEPGFYEVRAVRRYVLGKEMHRTDNFCLKHLQELRDSIVLEIGEK